MDEHPSTKMPNMSIDDIDDFFSIVNPVRRKVATTSKSPQSANHNITSNLFSSTASSSSMPRTNECVPTNISHDSYVPHYKRQSRVNNPYQTEYAKASQQQEEASLRQFIHNPKAPNDDEYNEADSICPDASVCEFPLPESVPTKKIKPHSPAETEYRKRLCAVYDNFNFKHKYDENLTITKYRQQILETVSNHDVTVIEGETGSGKTTQVPQFILDDCVKKREWCNIVVTQPRRIAAITIAKRVSMERRWPDKSICGYQIGMEEPHASENTRILYCTTGILLKKLIASKNLEKYSHVILDEVHERDSLSDFCLLLVRKLLHSDSKHQTKVILMSATIDAKMFADYFAFPNTSGTMIPAPILHVTGRTFVVQEFFVEDLASFGELPQHDLNDPKIDLSTYELAVSLVKKLDVIEASEQDDDSKETSSNRGAVLVFLPGLPEINEMNRLLEAIQSECQLQIFYLHSTITAAEQSKIFNPISSKKRKIILSTNIAESSVTIPDIKYVIDFCLIKNLVWDMETAFSSLHLVWASKQNCIQRKGRSGRVFKGRCYYMVKRSFFNDLPEYGVPEMQRCPLQQLVLKVKMLDIGEPKRILGLSLSPPKLDDIEKTIVLLFELGALTTLPDGKVNPYDGRLTMLGKILSDLPIDAKLGKLILLGYVFDLYEHAVIIAAGINCKSCFVQRHDSRLMSHWSKYDWSQGTSSDCFAILYAYQAWVQMMSETSDERKRRQWCLSRFLDYNQLVVMDRLIRDLYTRLERFNIPEPLEKKGPMVTGEQNIILKMLFCGAFYPNYFTCNREEEKDVIAEMSGYDPRSTVVVGKIPRNQGPLYRSAIERKFKSCQNEMNIHFEQSKAFIEFPRQPSDQMFVVAPAVLKALKMRVLRIDLNIAAVDDAVIEQHFKELSFKQTNRMTDRDRFCISGSHNELFIKFPPPHITTLAIVVSELVDCADMWAQNTDSEETLAKIFHKLNTVHLMRIEPLKVNVGMYCVCKYIDPNDGSLAFHRAKVQKITYQQTGYKNVPVGVWIFFIDYGNQETVAITDIYEMPRDCFDPFPCQAFRLQLSELRPNPIVCPDGRWTNKARNYFKNLLANSESIWLEIYSVVYGVVRGVLYGAIDGRRININHELIDADFAESCEELLQSRKNHEDRLVLARVDPFNQDFQLTPPDISGPSPQKPHQDSQPHDRRGQQIYLDGPRNPHEVNLYSMNNQGRLKRIRVGNDSINSVIIDDAPSDKHSRVLVAGAVGLNASGDTLLLTNTTLMPNIIGLPALAAMLFTPQMEIRINSSQSCMTGALCGLGWDSVNDGPMLPEHDMELTFDCEITGQDIKEINLVRHAMSIALTHDDEDPNKLKYRGDTMTPMRNSALENLKSLLKRPRKPMKETYFDNQYMWNMVTLRNLEISRAQMDENLPYMPHHYFNEALDYEQSVYYSDDDTYVVEPVVNTNRKLKHDDKQQLMRTRKHLSDLKRLAVKGDHSDIAIKCEVCKEEFKNRHQLFMHIATSKHQRVESLITEKAKKLSQTYK